MFSACTSVYNTITFESLHVHFSLRGYGSNSYESHRIKVKDTSVKEARNSIFFATYKTSISSNCGSIEDTAYEVCVQHGIFGCGGSNVVNAIFVTRPEIHAFVGGLL